MHMKLIIKASYLNYLPIHKMVSTVSTVSILLLSNILNQNWQRTITHHHNSYFAADSVVKQ